jgi:hypothetical protein
MMTTAGTLASTVGAAGIAAQPTAGTAGTPSVGGSAGQAGTATAGGPSAHAGAGGVGTSGSVFVEKTLGKACERKMVDDLAVAQCW